MATRVLHALETCGWSYTANHNSLVLPLGKEEYCTKCMSKLSAIGQFNEQ